LMISTSRTAIETAASVSSPPVVCCSQWIIGFSGGCAGSVRRGRRWGFRRRGRRRR
jgi:hypothetical protein